MLGENNKHNFALVNRRVAFQKNWYQISYSVNFADFASIFDKTPPFPRLRPVITQNMSFRVEHNNKNCYKPTKRVTGAFELSKNKAHP